MEKIKQLITSKKFWTLIAAIVAALAAFFTVSCSTQIELQRKGLHCDSIEYRQIIRSNNYKTALLWTTATLNPTLNPSRFAFEKKRLPVHFRVFSPIVNIFQSKTVCLRSVSPTLSKDRSFGCSIISQDMGLISFFGRILSKINFMSGSPAPISSPWFSAMVLPVFGVSRKGGRRGKPSGSKIKSIPLGGRHL